MEQQRLLVDEQILIEREAARGDCNRSRDAVEALADLCDRRHDGVSKIAALQEPSAEYAQPSSLSSGIGVGFQPLMLRDDTFSR
jgi:hypothetical protein